MYSKGDIVIISFPFSDLVHAKKRPMLVLAEHGEDIIGCAITSNLESEGILIAGFQEGKLPLESKIKYWQVHTILKGMILKKAAKLDQKTHDEVLSSLHHLLQRGEEAL